MKSKQSFSEVLLHPLNDSPYGQDLANGGPNLSEAILIVPQVSINGISLPVEYHAVNFFCYDSGQANATVVLPLTGLQTSVLI